MREVNEDTISLWSAKEDIRYSKYPLQGHHGTSDYIRQKTDIFEITAGVLQGNTLASYLFIGALDYALPEATNDTLAGFMLKKRQSSREPAV